MTTWHVICNPLGCVFFFRRLKPAATRFLIISCCLWNPQLVEEQTFLKSTARWEHPPTSWGLQLYFIFSLQQAVYSGLPLTLVAATFKSGCAYFLRRLKPAATNKLFLVVNVASSQTTQNPQPKTFA